MPNMLAENNCFEITGKATLSALVEGLISKKDAFETITDAIYNKCIDCDSALSIVRPEVTE